MHQLLSYYKINKLQAFFLDMLSCVAEKAWVLSDGFKQHRFSHQKCKL
jgi:hypothetical protein